ncbi:MAG: chorismate-binding protein [Candidatus Hydrothermae bacterium]|nr:chorismate-binding protein [Candidatus Hydrothermae bacterium]
MAGPVFELMDPETGRVRRERGALDTVHTPHPPEDGRVWVGLRTFPVRRREDPFWADVPEALWWVPDGSTPGSGPPSSSASFHGEPGEHPDLSTWKGWVRRTLDHLRPGILEKVVLARYRQQPGSAPTFQELLKSPSWGIRFRVVPLPGLVWFGITPETFLYWRQGRLVMDALAGTAPEPLAPIPPVLKEEHRAVVDTLTGTLRHLGFIPRVSPTQWKPVGSMVHLYTRVEADLPRAQIPRVVDALFPTPALAGAPREGALQWIETVEDFDRGGYGGLVGWYAPDEVFLVVAIRCGVARHGWVRWYAGAGIVPGMDPDELWEETAWKLRVMDTLLGRSRTSGPPS